MALAAAVALWLGMMLPAWSTYGAASLVAWLLTPLFMAQGRRARPERTSLRRNFQIAFGADLSEAAIRELTFRVLRHLAWLTVDFARLPRFGRRELIESCTPEDMATLRALVAEGKGVMGVGGHVGVFTLLGHIGGAMGLPLHTVSRPNHNPHLQRVLRDRQEIAGQRNVDNHGIARELLGLLGRGEMVGILIDEDAKGSSLFLPFFGTLASVNPSIARFHLMTGAPIVVLTVHRVGRGRYRLAIQGVVRHEGGGRATREQDQRLVMESITRLIERSIRVYPEQWFWNSRRWRTRPPGEAPGPGGIPPRVEPPIAPVFDGPGPVALADDPPAAPAEEPHDSVAA